MLQDAAGNKVGSFSYVDPHGAVHQTNYVADGAGYRVASNDLPLAPAGPGPVVPAETPEVVAAKINHFAAHAAALHRVRRSAWGGYYGPYATPVVTPSGHLADTPEVAAAKAAHFAEHARRGKRSVFYQTPASTSPLAPAIVPAPYAVPYAAAPLAYPYAAPGAIPATLTTIVNNPGHAVSYRID